MLASTWSAIGRSADFLSAINRVDSRVCAPASLLGFEGLASTSRNSNTSTSVLGMEDRLPEDEEQDPGSAGSSFILLEGEDWGQRGRGPSAWKSGKSSNRFSRLPDPSLIFCKVELGCFETGTSHLYLPTDFFSSS